VGSIPAQTCVNFDNLGIPGADAQDILLVVPTGVGSGVPTSNFDTTGELIFVGIPHPGESHVKVCNVSAGAIDPPAQTYSAVLLEV
jgi:hypothetical protein